jgi:hypothetical protein
MAIVIFATNSASGASASMPALGLAEDCLEVAGPTDAWYAQLDRTLLHSERRSQLQREMAV